MLAHTCIAEFSNSNILNITIRIIHYYITVCMYTHTHTHTHTHMCRELTSGGAATKCRH